MNKIRWCCNWYFPLILTDILRGTMETNRDVLSVSFVTPYISQFGDVSLKWEEHWPDIVSRDVFGLSLTNLFVLPGMSWSINFGDVSITKLFTLRHDVASYAYFLMKYERIWMCLFHCHIVLYGIVWYGVIWYDMVWYDMVWHGTVCKASYSCAWYAIACHSMV